MRYELYVITFWNGKKYIGVSADAEQRFKDHKKKSKRASRSMVVHHALHKYPRATMRVLCIGPKEYILQLESAAIAAYRTREREFGYNVGLGGEHSPVEGIGHSAKSRRKMSRGQKRRIRTPEELAWMPIIAKKRKTTPEYREKLRQAALARWADPEERKRQSEYMKNNHRGFSDEDRRKAALAKQTPEFRTQQSKRMTGVSKGNTAPRSAETKRKLSLAHMGKKITDTQKAALAAGRAVRWT